MSIEEAGTGGQTRLGRAMAPHSLAPPLVHRTAGLCGCQFGARRIRTVCDRALSGRLKRAAPKVAGLVLDENKTRYVHGCGGTRPSFDGRITG